MHKASFRLWVVCASVVVVALAGLASSSAALASFGFADGGNAPSVVVSNSANPSQPNEANPNDLDSQAGSHPFAMTTQFKLNLDPNKEVSEDFYAKDISIDLPSGFAGSIASVPQCRISDIEINHPGCPTSSQVGVATVSFGNDRLNKSPTGYHSTGIVPVYNIATSDGATAELAFHALQVVQPILVSVRTDGDYGVVAQTRNISEALEFAGVRVTLWGVPADPRHDAERFLPEDGVACPALALCEKHLHPGNANREPLPDSAPLTPFLTNPTKCGPASDYMASFVGDSWRHPGLFEPLDGGPLLSDPNWQVASTSMYPAGVTGCNGLAFNPSLQVTPDTTEADSPSGYGVDLHVPQSTAAADLASPALDNAVATLPQGVAINPGAADGLQACTDNAAEPPGSPGNEIGLGSNAQPACPHASQVGTVEVTTPLLPDVLHGEVYVSADHSNNNYAVFVVIRGDGLLIKLKATVLANPVTGQLTASFLNNPELPFTDFVLHFYGGPRAVLVNPSACGPATTSMDLTPWSATGPGGTGDATPSSTFDVSFDGFGGACPFPQPFAPSFTAGTTSIQAGGYSPFSATFSRNDADQRIDQVQVKTPVGLLGTLANVPLCGEPQASEGTCSSASQIGHVTAGVGSGAAPLYLPVPGQPPNPVYLTGPYKGAPFGLSFVIPAIAGPYNLGTVVVRAAINVDPNTAALTITSDPLPTIIDGIPIQVKTVNVLIDRPNFVFNPTNCGPMSIGGSVTGREGATATFSSPFQVTGCGDLGFKPQFKASTSGKTSKAKGASLLLKVTRLSGAASGQANFATAKIDLPKQLPSRLTTLQKACTAAVFNANPAACPSASLVGYVKVVTPILPVALEGPAYFVSHGGEAFPSVIFVLQGDNVRIDVVSTTFISKAGITSATLKAVPDAPFTSFELTFPEGKYSALTANGNLCKSKLAMPTMFTAQNGIVIHQSTPVAVTGCPKAKASKTRKARKTARRARKADHRNGGRA
jgi:hypothetical protein